MENSPQKSPRTRVLVRRFGVIVGALAVWFTVPAILGVVWIWLHVAMGGYGGLKQALHLRVGSFYNWGGPVLWFYTFVAALAALAIGAISYEARRQDDPTKKIMAVFINVMVVVVVLSLAQAGHLGVNSDKNVAKFYDASAVVYTPSLKNPPASLQYLLNNVKKDTTGHCAYINRADVPVCVKQGTLPFAGFAPRATSAAGARYAMRQSSGKRQNVELLGDTLTYLNGTGKDGVWSAIRDGSGSFQPTEGVVEWGGTGTPTECLYGGNDRFNMALNGTKKELARKLPGESVPQPVLQPDRRVGLLYYGCKPASGHGVSG